MYFNLEHSPNLPALKKLRTLFITFQKPESTFPVTAFRGAIIKKVGRDNVLFHNHLSDTQLAYRYPLVQYKMVNGLPALVCLDAGVDSMHLLFNQKSWSINVLGQPVELKIEDLSLRNWQLQVNGRLYRYRLTNWLALNEANYSQYRQLRTRQQRQQMLERVLTGNLLSFAKGINWFVEEQIYVSISQLHPPRPRRFKEKTVMTFEVHFVSNMLLPEYIGLGKGASIGFGQIHYI
jgi:hypothetical protein